MTGCNATVTVSQLTCAARMASLVPGARDPGPACLAAGTGPHRLPEAIGPAVNTFQKFLFDVCVCVFCATFFLGTGFVDWLEKMFICEKSFEMWIYLRHSLVVLR